MRLFNEIDAISARRHIPSDPVETRSPPEFTCPQYISSEMVVKFHDKAGKAGLGAVAVEADEVDVCLLTNGLDSPRNDVFR